MSFGRCLAVPGGERDSSRALFLFIKLSSHTMKNHRTSFFATFAMSLTLLSFADETATLIPEQAAPSAPAVHAAPKLEITPDEIISSRTVVRPDQTITIQEVVPQDIPLSPTAPTPAPVTPEQQAARAARIANRTEHRMTMLSCTVHSDEAKGTTRTHIRWTSQGKTPAEFYEAWSNVNFHHLTHLHAFHKANITHNVMFGIGDQSSSQAATRAAQAGKAYTPPSIPELPADSTTSPTYTITQGNPAESDLAALDGLHELYQQHHAAFIAKYAALKQENARRAAELAANPPDPTPNLIIRYWTPEKTMAEKLQEQQAAQSQQGGDQ